MSEIRKIQFKQETPEEHMLRLIQKEAFLQRTIDGEKEAHKFEYPREGKDPAIHLIFMPKDEGLPLPVVDDQIYCEAFYRGILGEEEVVDELLHTREQLGIIDF